QPRNQSGSSAQAAGNTTPTRDVVPRSTDPNSRTKPAADATTTEVPAGATDAPGLAIEPPPPPELRPQVEFKHTGWLASLTYTPSGRYVVGLDAANNKLLIHDLPQKPTAAPGDVPEAPRVDRPAAFNMSAPAPVSSTRLVSFSLSPDGKEIALS